MVTAYIMIKANTGDADRLREEVSALEGVTSAHIVAGDVDLIVKVDVPSPTEVKDIATTALSEIRGVENTQTYLAME
jgi:DNA-binding Lrp family transcriptional regulator